MNSSGREGKMLQSRTTRYEAILLLCVFSSTIIPRVEGYLHVWSGADNSALTRDFLATIDTSPRSPTFGTVTRTTEVDARGTEPHHIGLSANKLVLGAGSLLSFLSGQPDVFFFDLSKPEKPRYFANATATLASGTDAFLPLPNGGFLVTLMTSRAGKSPGRVAEFNSRYKLIAEHPPNNNIPQGFNPHGIAAAPEYNRMVTVNFLELASTVLPTSGPVLRHTVNIWNYRCRLILKTLDLGPAKTNGLMDVTYVPGSRGLFYVTSGFGTFFLVDSVAMTVTNKPVYELTPGTKVPGHCIYAVLKGGKRVLITSYALDEIRLVNMTDPYHPVDIQVYKIPRQDPSLKVGPHFISVDPSSNIFATSQYFVQQDPAVGIVTTATEKTVRLFKLAGDKNSFKPHPKKHIIDFKTEFPKRGACRPHGLVFK